MIDQYKTSRTFSPFLPTWRKHHEIRKIPQVRRKSESVRCKSTDSEAHIGIRVGLKHGNGIPAFRNETE
jgi:hypothetical protein